MEFTWSTFILEIINFLVLVWILKRFLYKPVLNVISQRQSGIEKKLHDAKTLHEEALSLQAQYENRLSEWEEEKQTARETLHNEIEQERKRLLQELNDSLEQERNKAKILEQRQRDEAQRIAEQHALQTSAQFVSRLLSRLADAALETRLIGLTLQDMASMDKEQVTALRTAWTKDHADIVIASAYPIEDKCRSQIQQQLTELVGQPVQTTFKEDQKLLAGLRISIGAWVMGANLRDELKAFTEAGHES